MVLASLSGAVMSARGDLDLFSGSGPGNHALARFLVEFGLDISLSEYENPRPQLSIELPHSDDNRKEMLASLDTTHITLNSPMEESKANLTKWHFEQLGYAVELKEMPDATNPDRLDLVIWLDDPYRRPEEALDFVHQVGFTQAAFDAR